MDYDFMERIDEGTQKIAELTNGEFSGPDAERIESMLTKGGYPTKAPDKILWGTRLWAVQVNRV